MSWGRNLGTIRLVTTDEVLTEVSELVFPVRVPIGGARPPTFVHNVRNDPDVDVLPQTRADFDAALAVYEARPDKEYSLTDCRSMVALRAWACPRC